MEVIVIFLTCHVPQLTLNLPFFNLFIEAIYGRVKFCSLQFPMPRYKSYHFYESTISREVYIDCKFQVDSFYTAVNLRLYAIYPKIGLYIYNIVSYCHLNKFHKSQYACERVLKYEFMIKDVNCKTSNGNCVNRCEQN